MAPSVLLPLLMHKSNEGLLCSDVATFTIIYNSNNETLHLVVEHWWGEKAPSYSCQCSLYFSVFYFIMINSSLSKQLKRLVLELKYRRSKESKGAFFCTKKAFLLDCTRGANQCIPAPAALEGLQPRAFLLLTSQTRSQVFCHVTLSIRAGGGVGRRMGSEALSSGAEFKGMPKTLVININTILIQYFF